MNKKSLWKLILILAIPCIIGFMPAPAGLRKVRISRSFLPKLTRWLKFRGSGPIFFPQTHRISLFRLFFPPFLALFPVFTEISPTDVSFGPPETGWPGWITSPVGYRFSAAPCIWLSRSRTAAWWCETGAPPWHGCWLSCIRCWWPFCSCAGDASN